MSKVEKEEKNTSTGLEIAVIGMAGRFPGAKNIQEFWNNLKNGVESISFFTDEELIESDIPLDLVKDPHYVKAKGVLEDMEYFDYAFFDYSPKEAEYMDPQIRILHECCYAALEDAGYNTISYQGSIGLYAGSMANLYWISRFLTGMDTVSEQHEAISLSDRDFLCTRVSYKLNLKGPAVTVQTACSTSLVAIHMACQGLLSGECDMVLAGGSSIWLPRKNGYLFQEGMVRSSDGHCRAFDAGASGTNGGDGVGIVVLKRLEDALAHGDFIYAVVKGSAMNNDGLRKIGYTAPSVEGQVEVIRAALQVAEVEPESIGFVEAHGTATILGDPIEVQALKLAFNTEKRGFCGLSSVKTNVGHLDAAAGVAGFIKAVLALLYRKIPPSLHFETPNPQIDFDNSPFYINTALREWENQKYPLRAGVSSFGIGGTNAHIILEQAPIAYIHEVSAPSPREYRLILLSARTETALERQTENLTAYFKENKDIDFADAAYTLQVGRRAFVYRRMLVCPDVDEAVEGLNSRDVEKVHTAFTDSEGENKRVVFLFSGQGSQYVNMGLDLYRTEPVFQQEMDRCFEILESQMGYDLKNVLYPGEKTGEAIPMDQMEIAQPLLFAFEYALARLLMGWGIQPHAMIGHSMGEYTAACLSGVFSLEHGLHLVSQRGKFMEKMPEGSMMSAALSPEELKPLLSLISTSDISIAAVNTPDHCVVSGTLEAVAAFEQILKAKGHECRVLHISRASHSAMMEPILEGFEQEVARVKLKEPEIPYISNITGTWITVEEATDAGYWARHLRRTVQFSNGVKELTAEPYNNAVFIEIGPGRSLSTFVRQHLAENGNKNTQLQEHRVINLVRHPREIVADDAYLLKQLGRLWLNGVLIDWEGFYAAEQRRRVPLPTYSFDRHFFCVDVSMHPGAQPIREAKKPAFHPQPKMSPFYSGIEAPGHYVSPQDEIEEKLVVIIQQVLGFDRISVTGNFFDLGGDSLKATTVAARIHKELNIKIPLSELFVASTIRKLAESIKGYSKETFVAIEAVEKKEYYVLSSGQRRFYMLQQMDPDNVCYNVPEGVWMEGKLDIERLEQTLRKLIQRHESLRTSFHQIGEEPVQKVHPFNNIKFAVESIGKNIDGDSPASLHNTIRHFIRPFDLSQPPLLRVGLTKQEDNKYLLLMDMHHIISDGSSLNIFINEFITLYSGNEDDLEVLKIQYKDFAQWQYHLLKSHQLKHQEEYWLKQLGEELPVLNMLTDYPRTTFQSFSGNTIRFKLQQDLIGSVLALTRETGTTLFVFLLAAFNVLLFKYTGQEDIIIGSTTAGRSHVDLENVIGMLIETLALRNYPQSHKSFEEFLNEVSGYILTVYENQTYPFGELMKKVEGKIDLSRNPLFDAMLMVQNVDMILPQVEGLKLTHHKIETEISKVDFTLEAVERTDGIDFNLEYCTTLFRLETMERLVAHFSHLIREVVANPAKKLSNIETMGEAERRQILVQFNDTQSEYDRCPVLHELIEGVVKETPHRVALVFEDQQTGINCGLTYQELDARAHRLARILRERGVSSNDIVGIISDPSPEMIIALLGILKSGGAYLPIEPDCPGERVKFMLADSSTRILVTDKLVTEKSKVSGVSEVINLNQLTHSTTQPLPNTPTHRLTHSPTQLCYVIYTSGSTGKPKGVMVEHQHLLAYLVAFQRLVGFTHEAIVIQHTSYSFDTFGEEIYSVLLKGGRVVIPAGGNSKDIRVLSDIIVKHDVNIIDSSPLVLNELNKDGGASVASIRTFLSGGDVLKAEYIGNLLKIGRVLNGYGPTETTVCCSFHDCTGEEISNIPIGKVISNYQVYILNKDFQLQPIGVPGELCISGEGVSRGYLNRPELTEEKFLDLTAKTREDTQNSSFIIHHSSFYSLYRTGDLARWLPDGTIEFLGRIDTQVKVRGYRIELEEIERNLLKHEGLKKVVVVQKEHKKGDKYICAYFEATTSREVTARELRDFLFLKLPDYMIPSYFVQLEQMPLTSHGKIDRKALPEPADSISTGIDYIPPETEIEKKLVGIWQEILGIERIGIQDDFFELGGDSILANRVIASMREELQVEVSLRKLFERSTVNALLEEVELEEKGLQRIGIGKRRAARDGHIPLSFSQERLWFLQQLDKESVAYHVPRSIRVRGTLDVTLIERCFTEIIRRHEILRTLFPTVDGRPEQRILEPFQLKIPVIDRTRYDEEAQANKVSDFVMEEGRRPFDFDKGPLLRITLLKLKEEEHVLVLSEHHLIHDGWTQGVMLGEFIKIYTAFSQGKPSPLPELPIQYADYAVWQREYMQGQRLESHLDYWKEKLADLPLLMELPADRPRPSVISGKGAVKSLILTSQQSQALKKYSKEKDATLFMTMLAVFKVLLSRYMNVGTFDADGNVDICVGTGVANRKYKELEGMLGMVINTLPLRTQLSGKLLFADCLQRVKATCVEAYEHEETPFEKIVEALQPERSLSYSPIIQVLFSFMDTPSDYLRLPGLELRSEEIHNRSSKFDLNVIVVPPFGDEEEEEGEIYIEWEYNTDIFNGDTVERMANHYHRLLQEILKDSQKSISALPMLEESETRQLLYEWNDTKTDYPIEKTIHQLFEEQAERTGHNIALVGSTRLVGTRFIASGTRTLYVHITYRELNEKSNRLVRLLREKGVQPNSIVGIMVDRSVEMIIGILGILKAGGAYLPIDLDYPEERIRYMLADSAAKILLTSRDNIPVGTGKQGGLAPLYLPLEHNPTTFHRNPQPVTSSKNLAYIIYTSGTTGLPKGILTTHHNVTRVVRDTNYIQLHKTDRLLQLSNYAFDGSVFDIYGALLNGAALVMIKKNDVLDLEKLSQILKKESITVFFLTTALFNSLVDVNINSLCHVRKVLFGGEQVSVPHSRRALQHIGKSRIIHVYGPTETTVYATYFFIDAIDESRDTIPIGHPIANTTAYILDKNQQPVSVGVPGELYIGGEGTARGYLNRPELTNEKFIPNPFVSGDQLYKSGDLVRRMGDGSIEFLGRVDLQVKIRGFRIEPGEIETHLLKHKEIKEVKVIPQEDQRGNRYLCAYVVPLQPHVLHSPPVVDFKQYLSQFLPDYMIPSFFIPIEKIPLTPNGKVDRKLLPEPGAGEMVEEYKYLAPRDAIEKKLVEIWSEVLNIGLDTPIGINDDFFTLGGHSLKAALLVSKVHKAFNVKIPIVEIFKTPFIRALSEYIKKADQEAYISLKPMEEKEYYIASAMQKRLFILSQLEGIKSAYHLPRVLTVEGKLNRFSMEKAFRHLIQHHESLRTSFMLINDEPMQKIHKEVEFKIEVYDLKRTQVEAKVEVEFDSAIPHHLSSIIHHFIRPFNLYHAPLLRVGLVKLEAEEHLLLFDMHHIVFDGTSMGILIRDVLALYEGKTLEPLKIQYKDFSEWQNSVEGRAAIERQESYWLHRFKGEVPQLAVFTDYPRPDVQSFEGNRISFTFEKELRQKIDQLNRETGTTLYMVLLAVYTILLSRYTRQEDIVVGSPVAGRQHVDFENIIGLFINALAMRNYPQPDKTFEQFLEEIRKNTLKAYENQGYPFDQLIEKLNIQKDFSRNPLFDAELAVQNMEIAELKAEGIRFKPYPHEYNATQVDLALYAVETSEGIDFHLNYCTALFKKETMERFIHFFKEIVSTVVGNKEIKLKDIEISHDMGVLTTDVYSSSESYFDF